MPRTASPAVRNRGASTRVRAQPLAQSPDPSLQSTPSGSRLPPPFKVHPKALRRVFPRITLLGLTDVDTSSQTWRSEMYYEFSLAYPKPGVAGVEYQHVPPDKYEATTLLLDQLNKGGIKDLKANDSGDFANLFIWFELHNAETLTDTEVWADIIKAQSTKQLIAKHDGLIDEFGGCGVCSYENGTAECARCEAAFERVNASFAFLSISFRYKVRISQHFQLLFFPLDHQVLCSRIVIRQEIERFLFATREKTHLVHPKKQIEEREVTSVVNAVNGAHSPPLSEFELLKQFVTWSAKSRAWVSRSGKQYAVLKTYILVTRRWIYHIWLVGFPLFAVACISLLSFYIEEKKNDNGHLNIKKAERFAALASLLFVAFQIKGLVAKMLPRLGTITFLDEIVLVVCMYVFGVSVAAVAIEEYADYVRPLLLAVVNALTWFHSVTIPSEYFWGDTLTTLHDTLYKCSSKNESFTLPLCTVNLTSRSYSAIDFAPRDLDLIESLDSFNCSLFIIIGIVLLFIYLVFGFLIKFQKRATALALGEVDADTLLECGPCRCQLTILCCGCRDSCCCLNFRRRTGLSSLFCCSRSAAGGSQRGGHTIRASKDQDIDVEEKPKDFSFHSKADMDDVISLG